MAELLLDECAKFGICDGKAYDGYPYFQFGMDCVEYHSLHRLLCASSISFEIEFREGVAACVLRDDLVTEANRAGLYVELGNGYCGLLCNYSDVLLERWLDALMNVGLWAFFLRVTPLHAIPLTWYWLVNRGNEVVSCGVEK